MLTVSCKEHQTTIGLFLDTLINNWNTANGWMNIIGFLGSKHLFILITLGLKKGKPFTFYSETVFN